MPWAKAPELDQQIGQATADLHTAQANLAIAFSTAERWALLFKKRFGGAPSL